MLEASIGLIWKCTNAIRIVLSLYPNSGLLNVTNGPHSHYSVATKLYFTKKFQKIAFKKNILFLSKPTVSIPDFSQQHRLIRTPQTRLQNGSL